MQETENIYEVIFSPLAPYILILSNLIILLCFIQSVWYTIKNNGKKIGTISLLFAWLLQIVYYLLRGFDLSLWLSFLFLSAFLIIYNSIKKIQGIGYFVPPMLAKMFALYLSIFESAIIALVVLPFLLTDALHILLTDK
ncbi:MAG: hypothetical protein ACI4HK_08715 [Ruminococcus sp.]